MKIAGVMKMPRPDQIAVGFAGSQKTLVIGLSTAISLGFSMLPILMYHVMQLIIGTILVDQIRNRRKQLAQDDLAHENQQA